MTYDYERGNFLLSYSAGKWWESNYSTGIARCSSPTGPCTSDPSGPWISSSNGRTGTRRAQLLHRHHRSQPDDLLDLPGRLGRRRSAGAPRA